MKACRFLFVWALLPIIMFSCNREQERIETPVSTPVGEVTFNASFGDAQNTRTVIKNDTEIWWSPNDAINVFYGDLTSGKFTATAGQESASAQFVGSFSAVTGIMEAENESRSFWAVYPYDVLNSCDGNSVTLTVVGNRIHFINTHAVSDAILLESNGKFALIDTGTTNWDNSRKYFK